MAKQHWNFFSLLSLQCPHCGRDTFRAGWFKTAKRCSACGQDFEPEPGFFAGAIYPMYGLGGITGGVAGLTVLFLGGSFAAILVGAFTALALASPYIFWVSRLSFLHANKRFFND